ncbi:MAG: GGDEF domain-containing protein [Desulfobacteraceae bacterium]|nr:GGDEF domain-containing protein [Desulfobacteraceae bacterium]
MLMLYMVVFVFGMFRLKLRQFILLAAIAIMSYVIVISILFRFNPDKINLNVEIMNLVVLAAVLPWFSILGSHINGLRQKLVKAKKRIEELAIYDELTQIYNRHQMYRILEREISLAQRGYPSFSICIFDLDHFKRVNDTFGHIAGDTVLKTLIAEIQKNLRDVDYIARFGGEEFVLILSYPDKDQSIICAERIKKIAGNVKYPGFPDDFGITVSIGVTHYQPDESVEATILRADTALYRAKAKGRNRVEYETTSKAKVPVHP